jgi:GNAT superfamily N-acetyltransferase
MTGDLTAITFDPHDEAQLSGLRALFEASACACYCRYWHFAGDKNDWQERCSILHGENERELAAAARARSDEARGVVALAGGVVVGWAKVAPAEGLKKLYDQRYYRGLAVLGGAREGVFTVGCMLVHPEHRGRGVTQALARAAVALAREAGARSIEAFPRVVEGRAHDEELWMGPASALREAGFTPVHAELPYPVLRLDLP